MHVILHCNRAILFVIGSICSKFYVNLQSLHCSFHTSYGKGKDLKAGDSQHVQYTLHLPMGSYVHVLYHHCLHSLSILVIPKAGLDVRLQAFEVQIFKNKSKVLEQSPCIDRLF